MQQNLVMKLEDATRCNRFLLHKMGLILNKLRPNSNEPKISLIAILLVIIYL